MTGSVGGAHPTERCSNGKLNDPIDQADRCTTQYNPSELI
jgi:hypothetical protein